MRAIPAVKRHVEHVIAGRVNARCVVRRFTAMLPRGRSANAVYVSIGKHINMAGVLFVARPSRANVPRILSAGNLLIPQHARCRALRDIINKLCAAAPRTTTHLNRYALVATIYSQKK